MDVEYRSDSFKPLEALINWIKTNKLVVLIHSSNFSTYKSSQDELESLVNLSKSSSVY